MDIIEIRYYQTSKGKAPFLQWLEKLRDIKARARVNRRLTRIRLGNFGDCKHLDNGVFEFRLHYGPGYRVYFGFDGERVVLLLSGGSKGTQKKDIKKVQEYWDDYQRRR